MLIGIGHKDIPEGFLFQGLDLTVIAAIEGLLSRVGACAFRQKLRGAFYRLLPFTFHINPARQVI